MVKRTSGCQETFPLITPKVCRLQADQRKEDIARREKKKEKRRLDRSLTRAQLIEPYFFSPFFLLLMSDVFNGGSKHEFERDQRAEPPFFSWARWPSKERERLQRWNALLLWPSESSREGPHHKEERENERERSLLRANWSFLILSFSFFLLVRTLIFFKLITANTFLSFSYFIIREKCLWAVIREEN